MNALRPLVQLPTCALGVRHDQTGLIEEIIFMPPGTPLVNKRGTIEEQFCKHMEAYLNDPHTLLDLPLAQRGTVFQQRVWHAIKSIPAGHTRHYGELAQYLGSAARAVGQACGANPFPLITPCHRVMAKTGLGGFAHAQEGWLLDTKRWLLQHEGAL